MLVFGDILLEHNMTNDNSSLTTTSTGTSCERACVITRDQLMHSASKLVIRPAELEVETKLGLSVFIQYQCPGSPAFS